MGMTPGAAPKTVFLRVSMAVAVRPVDVSRMAAMAVAMAVAAEVARQGIS